MTRKVSIYTAEECEKIATEAALRYVNDKTPGIYRHRQGKGFNYYDSKKNKITDNTTLKRIRALVIPPAYQEVWICEKANGHIQATGRDEQGRKQYIYHPLWNEVREQQKFETLIEFGRSLPLIRRQIRKQLKKTIKLNKEQVLCAIIYLLDTSCIRIGNSFYAQKNKSYGITTLRKKHLAINTKKAILDFPGKNNQIWHVVLKNKRLIKLLKKCEEIPGYELFKYYDEEGELNSINSQDVNGYLQSITQHPFTAKTFRTWIACRECFYRLLKKEISSKALKAVIKEVAELLGHTPSVCQKSYIDPEIITWWKKGHLGKWLNQQKIALSNKDKLLLTWLEQKRHEYCTDLQIGRN